MKSGFEFGYSGINLREYIDVILSSLTIASLVFVASMDIIRRRIPNVVVATVALTFFGHALAEGMPLDEWGGRLGVAAVTFAVCAACFLKGWLGGGDVKLATAVMLWAGPALAPLVLVGTGAIGIVMALVGLTIERLEHRMAGTMPTAIAVFSASRGVPYGIGLAASGFLVVLAQW